MTADPLKAAPSAAGRNIVCVIASLGCGGAERAMAQLAGGLHAAGWQVRLVTLDATVADHFAVPGGVCREAYPFFGSVPCRWFDLRGQARRFSALREQLVRQRPDAVISFLDRTNIIVLLALWMAPVPVIVAEHTDPRYYAIGWRWRLLRRIVYPRARQVVTLTEKIQRWAESRWPRWRACVIPNGIAAPSNRGLDARPGWFGARNLVAMGRLGPEKGFDLLIEAFAGLAGRFPEWTLTIFGEGAERAALQSLVASKGLDGRVFLPGQAQAPYAVLPHADLFALSSRLEGFPMVLIEAMAAGLPAVSFATPSGGPDAVIRAGIDGVLVPPLDVAAFRGALERLMADDTLRIRMGHRAREVVERFSERQVLALWRDLIDRVALEARSG